MGGTPGMDAISSDVASDCYISAARDWRLEREVYLRQPGEDSDGGGCGGCGGRSCFPPLPPRGSA